METTDTIRPTRRLARPRDGRWLGGVAAALGEYFDLSPAIYRVAFVALALAGGTGILLYVAAWLVIPDADEESSVAERMLRDHADRPSRAIGLALVAFVAILALSEARWWPSPGNLWLAVALGIAALVWWEASPRGAVARHDATGAPLPTRRRQSLFAVATGHAPRRLGRRRAARRDRRLARRLADRARRDGDRRRRARRRRCGRRACASSASPVSASSSSRRSRSSSPSASRCSRAGATARRTRRRPPGSPRRTSSGSAATPSTCTTSRSRVGETHVKTTLGIGYLLVKVPARRDRRGRRPRERRQRAPARARGATAAPCTSTSRRRARARRACSSSTAASGSASWRSCAGELRLRPVLRRAPPVRPRGARPRRRGRVQRRRGDAERRPDARPPRVRAARVRERRRHRRLPRRVGAAARAGRGAALALPPDRGDGPARLVGGAHAARARALGHARLAARARGRRARAARRRGRDRSRRPPRAGRRGRARRRRRGRSSSTGTRTATRGR